MKVNYLRLIGLLIVLVVLFSINWGVVQASDGITGSYGYSVYLPLAVSGQNTQVNQFPNLSDFIDQVKDGQSNVVRGMYVTQKMALSVVQQPDGNYGYISTASDTATQFMLAATQDVIGLLAHNNLAGKHFSDLSVGNRISIIYGDGTVAQYTVSEVYQYQALSPNSSTSDFVDLNSGELLTAADIFIKFYMAGDQVTLQTCLERNGNLSWGRLFIVALPIP